MSEQKPSVGRIVHYVYDTDDASEVRPAIITRVNRDGTVNLRVFLDFEDVFSNGECDEHDMATHQQNVPYNPVALPGCWTWPPRV